MSRADERSEREHVRPRGRVLMVLAVAVFLVPVLVWRDWVSMERANRLYRRGDLLSAVEIYRDGILRTPGVPAAEYNLGTTLLRSDPDSAEEHLASATQGSDRVARQRGYYNLGYRYLTRFQLSLDPDSSVAALTVAVANNRAALRLDPTDESARWNLSLAQRRLDALVPPEQVEDRENAGSDGEELTIEDQALTRSETADAESGLEPEDPRAADNRGERQGAQEGAREAWATQDPGPMTREAAVSLLRAVEDHTETLIRGILWSHRPDIAWWESQPYPGGGW